MNKVMLTGFFCGKISEVRENCPVLFKIGAEREYRSSEGKKIIDYLSIKAWGDKNISLINKLNKGDYISVIGHIKINKYTKDNNTIYSTEIEMESIESPNLKVSEVNENQTKFDEVTSVTKEVDKDNIEETYTKVDDEDSPFTFDDF